MILLVPIFVIHPQKAYSSVPMTLEQKNLLIEMRVVWLQMEQARIENDLKKLKKLNEALIQLKNAAKALLLNPQLAREAELVRHGQRLLAEEAADLAYSRSPAAAREMEVLVEKIRKASTRVTARQVTERVDARAAIRAADQAAARAADQAAARAATQQAAIRAAMRRAAMRRAIQKLLFPPFMMTNPLFTPPGGPRGNPFSNPLET